VSWAIVIAATLFALALTILILRSIVLPLGRIGEAMAALTSGRTDVEISLNGHDELAAMARTLALFRASLVERNRLADEREQALQRLEAARDEVTAANQILQVTFDHMSQGVTMFDRSASWWRGTSSSKPARAARYAVEQDRHLRRFPPLSRGPRRLRAGRSRPAGAQAAGEPGRTLCGRSHFARRPGVRGPQKSRAGRRLRLDVHGCHPAGKRRPRSSWRATG
jgi:hypothetical protein